MRENEYDAIVVGARCAGSPTAMLLARKGYKVLLVDRARFPSDTISTHLIHPPGVAALKEWGLLDRLVASGCPPIDTYQFDFERFTIAGAPGTVEAPLAYAPRRTVLDKLLVDAASEAGAEVRATDIWGITPLVTAIYHGQTEAADLLVPYGLFPDTVWVAASWYRPGGQHSPEEIARQYLSMVLDGIAPDT